MMDANTVVTALNEELGLIGLKRVDQDDLYDAMDTLVQHKIAIECRLAKRHLKEGALVLYDVTSSYVEGKKNAWAEFGCNKDKKRGQETNRDWFDNRSGWMPGGRGGVQGQYCRCEYAQYTDYQDSKNLRTGACRSGGRSWNLEAEATQRRDHARRTGLGDGYAEEPDSRYRGASVCICS